MKTHLRLHPRMPMGWGCRFPRGNGHVVRAIPEGGCCLAAGRMPVWRIGKKTLKRNANFPQAIHIFFSSKKNVNRLRKIRAFQGPFSSRWLLAVWHSFQPRDNLGLFTSGLSAFSPCRGAYWMCGPRRFVFGLKMSRARRNAMKNACRATEKPSGRRNAEFKCYLCA